MTSSRYAAVVIERRPRGASEPFETERIKDFGAAAGRYELGELASRRRPETHPLERVSGGDVDVRERLGSADDRQPIRRHRPPSCPNVLDLRTGPFHESLSRAAHHAVYPSLVDTEVQAAELEHAADANPSAKRRRPHEEVEQEQGAARKNRRSDEEAVSLPGDDRGRNAEEARNGLGQTPAAMTKASASISPVGVRTARTPSDDRAKPTAAVPSSISTPFAVSHRASPRVNDAGSTVTC